MWNKVVPAFQILCMQEAGLFRVQAWLVLATDDLDQISASTGAF